MPRHAVIFLFVVTCAGCKSTQDKCISACRLPLTGEQRVFLAVYACIDCDDGDEVPPWLLSASQKKANKSSVRCKDYEPACKRAQMELYAEWCRVQCLSQKDKNARRVVKREAKFSRRLRALTERYVRAARGKTKNGPRARPPARKHR